MLRIAREAEATCEKEARSHRAIDRKIQGAFYEGKAAAYHHMACHIETLLRHWEPANERQPEENASGEPHRCPTPARRATICKNP